MPHDLSGKVAVVGGASRGLGFACADALAARGCDLALLARGESALRDAAERLAKAHGTAVIPVTCDIGDGTALARAQAVVEQRFGAVHVLVNNTGGPPAATLTEATDPDWQRAFDSLLMGPVRMTRWAIPHMRRAGFGRIVTLASTVAKEPAPRLVLSASLRAGAIAMGKALAREVAGDGITVNTVCPGAFDTDRARALDEAAAQREGKSLQEVRSRALAAIPAGRIGAPAELGEVVGFLCSPAGAAITGQTLSLDGGAVRGLFG